MRADAVRSPPRLDVRDDFAFEPRQVGVHRKNDEKQNRDFCNRDEQLVSCGEEKMHGQMSASGKDSIIVHQRLSVPLVKSVSFAERINPTGTS